ncbi:MAG: hypothetical protein P8X82_11900 [Gemmatimonadales bacterium]
MMRNVCTVCVTFILALLVIVPLLFVWNLFWNGQGIIDWRVSIAIAGMLALVFPIVIAARNGAHTRQQ